MKKEHVTDEFRKNVSLGLKRYFKDHNVWNKGTKKSKEYYDSLRINRRKNDNYYLNELKTNAHRNHKLGYDQKRIDQIRKADKERKERIGYPSPKSWSDEDIKFLIANFQDMPYEEICYKLNRSWASINHKLGRLKLRKYNSWKN